MSLYVWPLYIETRFRALWEEMLFISGPYGDT